MLVINNKQMEGFDYVFLYYSDKFNMLRCSDLHLVSYDLYELAYVLRSGVKIYGLVFNNSESIISAYKKLVIRSLVFESDSIFLSYYDMGLLVWVDGVYYNTKKIRLYEIYCDDTPSIHILCHMFSYDFNKDSCTITDHLYNTSITESNGIAMSKSDLKRMLIFS